MSYITDMENQYGDYDDEMMAERCRKEKEELLEIAVEYGYPLHPEDDDLTFKIFAMDVLPNLEAGWGGSRN